MTEAQLLGTAVVALSTLISLFMMVYKPLSENTKAMTTLAVKIETFSKSLDEQKEEHKEHLKEFSEYKEHISEGQRRQWEKIDEHSQKLQEHETEIQNLKNKQLKNKQ